MVNNNSSPVPAEPNGLVTPVDFISPADTVTEQPMDEVARVFHKEHDFLHSERRLLAQVLSRVVALDGHSLQWGQVGAVEMAARQSWLSKTVEALERAPTLEAFGKAVDESLKDLIASFPEKSNEPSREVFKSSGLLAFSRAVDLASNPAQGSMLWKHLAVGNDPVLSMTQSLAHQWRTASLAAKGGDLDAESGLSEQKVVMMKRFGFKLIAFEGATKSPSEQSFILDKLTKVMAEGVKDLGLSSESNVGMGGQWSLRIIDKNVNEKALNRNGYVLNDFINPVLALSADSKDPGTLKHEWTHMLDAKLGEKARELVKKDFKISEETKKNVSNTVFFSNMPREVQRMMPSAFDGYWQVVAAAQGLLEGASLRSIELERQDKLDALSRRVQSRLLSNPALMTGLSEFKRLELDNKISGAVKNLIIEPKLIEILFNGKTKTSYDLLVALQGAQGEKVKYAMDDIAPHLEEQFGAAWRTGADGVERSAYEQLGLGLKQAITGIEKETIRDVASMWGAKGAPLNPENRFANGSHYLDKIQGEKGYWADPTEMFARTMGRPKSLVSRVDALATLRRAFKGYTSGKNIQGSDRSDARAASNAYAPELNQVAQHLVRDGFAKMTKDAGLGEAKLRLGAREWVENVILSTPARVVMETLTEAVKACQRGEAVCGSVTASVVKNIYGSLVVLRCAMGRINQGVAGLAAFGGYLSGSPVLSEIKVESTEAVALPSVELEGSLATSRSMVKGIVGTAQSIERVQAASLTGSTSHVGVPELTVNVVSEHDKKLRESSPRHGERVSLKTGETKEYLKTGLVSRAAVGAEVGIVVSLAKTLAGSLAMPDIAAKLAAKRFKKELPERVQPSVNRGANI